MNVVNDKLFLPLTCIGEFNHANHMMSVVKVVKKLVFQLLPTIDWTRLKVGVLVEGITFQGTNKLFYHEITITFDIVPSLYKVSYMLPCHRIVETLVVDSLEASLARWFFGCMTLYKNI